MSGKMNEQQKNMLISIIKKHKSKIENKKTDSVTNKEKKLAWEAVAREYNAQSTISRTEKQLKTCYNNIKKKYRLDLASQRRDVFQTGGGPSTVTVSDNPELAELVEKSTTPMRNPFDDDAVFNNEEELDDEDLIIEDYEIEEDGNSNQLEQTDVVSPAEEVISPERAVRSPNTSITKLIRKHKRTLQSSKCELATLQEEAFRSKISLNKAKETYYKAKLEKLNERCSSSSIDTEIVDYVA